MRHESTKAARLESVIDFHDPQRLFEDSTPVADLIRSGLSPGDGLNRLKPASGPIETARRGSSPLKDRSTLSGIKESPQP